MVAQSERVGTAIEDPQGRDPLRRSGHPAARGDRVPAQADGRGRWPPGALAPDEALRPPRTSPSSSSASGTGAEMIKDYFLNYEAWNNDFTITLGEPAPVAAPRHAPRSPAGRSPSPTPGRTPRPAAGSSGSSATSTATRFIVTYGDGLADVDLTALLAFHGQHGTARDDHDDAARSPASASSTSTPTRSRRPVPREAAGRRVGQLRLLRVRAGVHRLPRRGLRPRADAARTARERGRDRRVPTRRASGSRWTPTASS